MKLPKSDRRMVKYITKGGKEYLITQSETNGRFTLWVEAGKNVNKLATSDSPIKLYSKADSLDKNS